jgi:MSHA biogenesis protein MshM
MYTEFFGLTEPPFSLTPNTSFFIGSATHQEALNTLLVAVRSGEGFMKIVGEVGTGKTLLCRTFLNRLEQDGYITAYIPNPYVGPNTLLLGVADELGIAYPEKLNQHQLLKLLTEFLVAVATEGKRVVLCLDEAQAMPVETLEALRLLTNLETERAKLLQVVLFGQPELNQRLDEERIRQLKQRITFTYQLRSLSQEEVGYYVGNRLAIAGYKGMRLFTDGAIKRLYRGSGGVPRLVNILANKALLAAYGEGQREVKEKHVDLAVADTESASGRLGHLRSRMARYVATLFTTAVVSVGLLRFFGQL